VPQFFLHFLSAPQAEKHWESLVQLFLLALLVLASTVIESQGYHRFGLKSKDDHKKMFGIFFYLNVSISAEIMYEIIFMPFLSK